MKFLTNSVLALSLLAGVAATPAFAQTSTDTTGTATTATENGTECSPTDKTSSTTGSQEDSNCAFEQEHRKSDNLNSNNVDPENPSQGGVDPNGSSNGTNNNGTGGVTNGSNSTGNSSNNSGGSSN